MTQVPALPLLIALTTSVMAATAASSASAADAQAKDQARGECALETSIAHADDRFARLDANGDGVISIKEMETCLGLAGGESLPTSISQSFEAWDENGDGMISRGELQVGVLGGGSSAPSTVRSEASDQPAEAAAGGPPREVDMSWIRAEGGNLIGLTVVDALGEPVGALEAIVLDPSTSEAFGVVSLGGILGIGAREVVVPFGEIEVTTERLAVMTRTQDQFEQLPDYDAEAWDLVRFE